MKKQSLLLIILLAIFLRANASSDTIRVLFIGNSITYYNDMPTMFHDIAISQGKNVAVTMYAPGGTGFVNHYVDPAVFDLFRNNIWDIIVLQPGSGESAGATFPVDTTIKRGRVLLDSIYHYSPCARVYLYQIPYGVPSASTYSTYFSVQTIIRDSVLTMADSLKLQMIPAGECTRAYYAMHQNLLLHNAYNDIHPSAAGSFLAAAACYTSIFQNAVSGCTFYSTLQQDTAEMFFSIVDTVVLNHIAEWRINTYNLHSEFDFITAGSLVDFICQSSNYSSVFWDFGDNNTSTTTNPEYTYTTSGNFLVKLFSYNNAGCVDSTQKTISIIETGSFEIDGQRFTIFTYPNPASDILFVEFPSNNISRIRLFAADGSLVIEKRNLSDGKTSLEVSDLKPGLYYLEALGEQIFRNVVVIE